MDTKKLFEKYRARLVCEGILKSFLCGLIVAFAIDAVFALVTSVRYFTEIFKWWFLVALGVGLVIGLIVAIVLYFTVFRPDTKKIARRVDKLGLEERAITMLELEQDESYIAMRQRDDAKAKIKEANSKSMHFSIAKPLIIAVAVVCAVGVLSTTFNVLATFNVMDNPFDQYETVYVTVEYRVLNDNGGRIESGENGLIYSIEKGESTTNPVFAVADDGFEFLYWLDEMGNVLSEWPERQEIEVNKDMVIYAAFGPLMILDSNDPTQPYDPYAYPRPTDPGDDPEPKPDPNAPPEDGNLKWEENNQIKDNNSSYYPEYDLEKNDAMEEIENDSNLSGKHKEGVGSYYEMLDPPEKSDSDLDVGQ